MGADLQLHVVQVFAGLWRLGAASCTQLLGVAPDIAAYAKLLTGADLPCMQLTGPSCPVVDDLSWSMPGWQDLDMTLLSAVLDQLVDAWRQSKPDRLSSGLLRA